MSAAAYKVACAAACSCSGPAAASSTLVAAIYGHVAYSTKAWPKALTFGPAQAWPGLTYFVPVLARPETPGCACVAPPT